MKKLLPNAFRAVFLALTITTMMPAAAAARAASDEEFVGPFPSWRDLRRDYGATGDGKADDTAALQRALDDLVKHEKACVLFIPRGTYRLTSTLKTARKAHTDCQGVAVIGADPAPTVPVWDGRPDRQLELDGHLGVVLAVRRLRARRPQRDGQLARVAVPLPALSHGRHEHPEPDGLLRGEQHEHRLEPLLRFLDRAHLGLARE